MPSIVFCYLLSLLIFQRKLIYFPETHSIELQQELAKWLIRDEFNIIKNLQNYMGTTAVLVAGEDEIMQFLSSQSGGSL